LREVLADREKKLSNVMLIMKKRVVSGYAARISDSAKDFIAPIPAFSGAKDLWILCHLIGQLQEENSILDLVNTCTNQASEDVGTYEYDKYIIFLMLNDYCRV
jgi:hypothetical protein